MRVHNATSLAYKILGIHCPVALLFLCCAEAQSHPIPVYPIFFLPASRPPPHSVAKWSAMLTWQSPTLPAPEEVMGRLNSTPRRGTKQIQRLRECKRKKQLENHKNPRLSERTPWSPAGTRFYLLLWFIFLHHEFTTIAELKVHTN